MNYNFFFLLIVVHLARSLVHSCHRRLSRNISLAIHFIMDERCSYIQLYLLREIKMDDSSIRLFTFLYLLSHFAMK